MKLLLLTKDNIPFARGEAETLLGNGTLDENILLIDTKKTTDRLACTRVIAEVLFEATEKNIEQKMKAFNWNKIVKKTFAVTFRDDEQMSQSLSKHYGGIIYDLLKNPKVKLDNPGANIFIFRTKKKLYVTKFEWENTENFLIRNQKTWPAQRPISIQPRIARICVNLTGATKELYDPMCGIGAFLVEAGLIGMKVIGSDIDRSLVQCTKLNLEHHKIKNYKVFQKNALEITKNFDYLVTDLPYGKNTRDISKDLYPQFIKMLEKHLKKRAVIVLPHFAKGANLFKKSKLKLKAKYSYYLHKSLQREIFVLEPK